MYINGKMWPVQPLIMNCIDCCSICCQLLRRLFLYLLLTYRFLKDVTNWETKKCLLGELGCEHSMTCNYVQCKYEYTIFNKLLIRTLLFFLIQFNCLIPLQKRIKTNKQTRIIVHVWHWPRYPVCSGGHPIP